MIEVVGEIYGGDILVYVELEEGFFRICIVIVGMIVFSVYGVVVNYKGFKESIVVMCEDVCDFLIDVC